MVMLQDILYFTVWDPGYIVEYSYNLEDNIPHKKREHGLIDIEFCNSVIFFVFQY